MADYDLPDSGKVSKINSAMLVNLTLNNLWVEYYQYFMQGRFLDANSNLDCIWTILGGESNIQGKDIEVKYNEIEKELSESGGLQNSISIKGFNGISKGQITKLINQKNILLKKALFLRRLQNNQGKGTAYEDADEEEAE